MDGGGGPDVIRRGLRSPGGGPSESLRCAVAVTQTGEETSAERTCRVVVCFYVFGLYHSFMMKKTIYRTCLLGRTGPREMVHADSPLAPILPRHGDGRGFAGGGEERLRPRRDSRVPLAIILTSLL